MQTYSKRFAHVIHASTHDLSTWFAPRNTASMGFFSSVSLKYSDYTLTPISNDLMVSSVTSSGSSGGFTTSDDDSIIVPRLGYSPTLLSALPSEKLVGFEPLHCACCACNGCTCCSHPLVKGLTCSSRGCDCLYGIPKNSTLWCRGKSLYRDRSRRNDPLPPHVFDRLLGDQIKKLKRFKMGKKVQKQATREWNYLSK